MSIQSSSNTCHETLSEREAHILRSLMTGKKDKEIAYCLGLSERTIRNEIKRICGKFGVETRMELAYQVGQLAIILREIPVS